MTNIKPVESGKADRDNEIVVFDIVQNSACAECGCELFKGSFLRMENDKPLCMTCADLDHLVFLPRGDTALTRRSKKYSTLSAVVLRFSRTRGRYERQDLLVEMAALARAEQECLSDEDQRAAARERAALVRERADAQYAAQFAHAILTHYPGCSPKSASEVAAHACEKYSGRVGRSGMAKAFDLEAITLAVRAHVRHCHTRYDGLLARGVERSDARASVAAEVEAVLQRWRHT